MAIGSSKPEGLSFFVSRKEPVCQSSYVVISCVCVCLVGFVDIMVLENRGRAGVVWFQFIPALQHLQGCVHFFSLFVTLHITNGQQVHVVFKLVAVDVDSGWLRLLTGFVLSGFYGATGPKPGKCGAWRRRTCK